MFMVIIFIADHMINNWHYKGKYSLKQNIMRNKKN